MRRHELVYAVNAGGVDPDAVSRIDLEQMRLAGEHPVANLLPLVLGPATLRPGSETLAAIPSDAQTRQIRFLRSVDTSYLLLMSAGEMRVSLNGEIQQVPDVDTAIASGSWSNVSTSPATATGGTTLSFTATTTRSAKLRQTVTVASGDQAVTHILRVVVSAGPVFLRVGTSAGGEQVLADVELETGTHKISFVPGTGTIYVEVRADDPVTRGVSSIQFEATLLGGTGDLVLPTPWASFDDVKNLRTWQSIDTMFVGDGTYQQRRIEHRGPLSWGISLYKTEDGPFVDGSKRLTITPSARTGNPTLTASESVFKSGHVGALIELTQIGKTVVQDFDDVDQASDYITVVGSNNQRYFYISGSTSSFNGTVVLEQSLDPTDPTTWVIYNTYSNSGTGGFTDTLIDDGLDNITAHYRFRCTVFTSGTTLMTLRYPGGVQNGRARITGYTSGTSVSAEVIVPFGATTATRNWRIGDWSDVRGWPRTPIIVDDRLHWFRDDKDFAALVSDYYTFDDGGEGDDQPFTRSVGVGGQDGVLWAIELGKLLVGTASFEASITASDLDEPLTPSRYTVRKPSRRGCADIPAVIHDEGAFFVQRSRRRLYELNTPDGARYRSEEVSRLNPAAYRPGIAGHAVQQQPNLRHWCWLDDGTAVVLTEERADKVVAITTVEIAGGLIEDIAVLPSEDQDDVYMIVNRDGSRYHERLAKEADQRSVSTCALLDGHKVLTGSISSITGGSHLAGQTVQVWADGQRRADVTLDGSGNGSLGATYSRVVYGLEYSAVFKSVKLAHAAGLGTAVGQTKIVHGAGLIFSASCLDGVRVGRDADNTDPLPDIVNGSERTTNQFFAHYDQDILPINSDWNPDARIYVSIDSAEGPCTLQAIVLDIETRDGAGNG